MTYACQKCVEERCPLYVRAIAVFKAWSLEREYQRYYDQEAMDRAMQKAHDAHAGASCDCGCHDRHGPVLGHMIRRKRQLPSVQVTSRLQTNRERKEHMTGACQKCVEEPCPLCVRAIAVFKAWSLERKYQRYHDQEAMDRAMQKAHDAHAGASCDCGCHGGR